MLATKLAVIGLSALVLFVFDESDLSYRIDLATKAMSLNQEQCDAETNTKEGYDNSQRGSDEEAEKPSHGVSCRVPQQVSRPRAN
jgi:hypothetical protein